MFDRDKIIYLAGIIDGEGSVQIEIQSQNAVRKMHYYSIRLLVINTNKDLMDWLSDNFGGKVTARKLIPNRKQCYKWNICSFKAAEILKSCIEFMIIKKKGAEVLIEFMQTKPKGTWNVTDEIQKHRKILYDRLKKLNTGLL